MLKLLCQSSILLHYKWKKAGQIQLFSFMSLDLGDIASGTGYGQVHVMI